MIEAEAELGNLSQSLKLDIDEVRLSPFTPAKQNSMFRSANRSAPVAHVTHDQKVPSLPSLKHSTPLPGLAELTVHMASWPISFSDDISYRDKSEFPRKSLDQLQGPELRPELRSSSQDHYISTTYPSLSI